MMTSTLDLPDLLRLEPDLCLSLVMLVPTIRTIQSPLKHFEAFCLEMFKIFKCMNYCNIWVNVLMVVLWVLAMFFPFSSCGIRTCRHRVNPVVSTRPVSEALQRRVRVEGRRTRTTTTTIQARSRFTLVPRYDLYHAILYAIMIYVIQLSIEKERTIKERNYQWKKRSHFKLFFLKLNMLAGTWVFHVCVCMCDAARK